MNISQWKAALFFCALSILLGGCSGPFKFSDSEYRVLGNSTSNHRN
ncbi:hypothetical protein CFBP1590__3067 [Pseudomonas viridiflava]|uniref:Type VI secretion protein n=1 Tax=Pseudomonas viridiflava TaxID=33069 RepID=A0A1Y6JQR5_PSEVI|nr:type VI secretion protein [Pseudomonas viridiflava]SMS10653.1 hypothetical protein CFBP1590__3067 [Pseudomonas viridiflava]VVN35453.1 hypothetical protein PS634_05082 [Pseudomonas fluorescens]VVO07641.1 hypothetical protein PS689_03181 [Pseudomonas fluorescens]